jgi:hypothetical protein
MIFTKTHKIIISAVAVIILLGIYVTFDRKSKTESENKVMDIVQTATTTDKSDITNTSGVTYKIEPAEIKEVKRVLMQVPDLDRPVTKSPLAVNVLEKDILVATQKIKGLQTLLKTDSTNFPNWMDLASYQKMAGDYDGAILSWRYASELKPTDFVSVANIGNTYAYYLKDNAQAEMYYNEAISKGPTAVYLYVQLAGIYTDIFKNPTKAKALVAQGLLKVPNDPELLQLQESLK